MSDLRAFTVLGQPHPAERPRAMPRKGKGGRMAVVWLTPDRTLAAERAVADAYLALYRDLPPMQGSLVLSATFWRNTRRACDLDNLLKTVMDGLTKAGAWGDDSQVATLRDVERIYGVPLSDARTVVTLSTIE